MWNLNIYRARHLGPEAVEHGVERLTACVIKEEVDPIRNKRVELLPNRSVTILWAWVRTR